MIELEAAFLAAKTNTEVWALLRMILTEREIKTYRTRWKACQMSAVGMTQREIRDDLKIGLATATRAARTARQHRTVIRKIIKKAKP